VYRTCITRSALNARRDRETHQTKNCRAAHVGPEQKGGKALGVDGGCVGSEQRPNKRAIASNNTHSCAVFTWRLVGPTESDQAGRQAASVTSPTDDWCDVAGSSASQGRPPPCSVAYNSRRQVN